MSSSPTSRDPNRLARVVFPTTIVLFATTKEATRNALSILMVRDDASSINKDVIVDGNFDSPFLFWNGVETSEKGVYLNR